MTGDRIPPHWIRPNETTRIPRRHLVIDTEAHQAELPGVKVQTFRLGAGAGFYQTKAGRPWRSWPMTRFATPAELWGWVDARTVPKRRTILVAHNLAYDLRVARAFTELPALGWQLDMVRLDGGSAWCQWRRAGRSLCCVDTVSWFGTGLDKVAQLIGTDKVPLPAWDADDEEWYGRCERDVELLAEAWRRTVDWIQADDLGNWKPTGAGQGWAFLRHRHLTHRVLHHGVDRVARLEREAAWTGRCEAWRWGRLPAGRWTEWDFASAYAQVCEDHDVPVRLAGHLGPKSAMRAVEGTQTGGALVHATITTQAPVCPTRGPHGILWPTGTFTSWLWDVEARAALQAGADVQCSEGWGYQTGPALRQWAGWVLDLLNQNTAEVDPLVRLVVKGWSRTTVGRFGAQWSTWEDRGEAWGQDVQLRQATNGDTGRNFRMMMVGGRCLAEGPRADAPDGAPQVMSFVMAACRVRLWKAMQVAGLANVAYVDTDGLIVNTAGGRALELAGLPGLRPKSRWSSVEVLGPRQLVLGGKLRAAGIPLAAVRSGPRSWDAEVWRSLPASLRSGELDRVTMRDRRFTLRGVDHRRVHLPGGLTAPVCLSDALDAVTAS